MGGSGQSGAKTEYTDFGVDLGVVDGHRKQFFRATEAEANALAAELRKDRKELGDLALALSPADKLDAVRAIQLLAGKTTLEAAIGNWWGEEVPETEIYAVANDIEQVQFRKYMASRHYPGKYKVGEKPRWH
jgi:hypothetical protein